ncbi:hypothetical protein SDC9_49812 [bioreactor metagenome]|uniref:Diguanylate cyclase n=1 Tax=bioreactor metagenome TaxID=1076179 RepID=A0A644WI48_9ZZZZ
MKDNQKLRTSQYNRYKYIIENVKDVIWELDKEFRFTFVSPNAKEMSGYEPKELIGLRITDFLAEESREYVMKQIACRLQRRINGECYEVVLYDVQFICKDKTVIWVEVSANIIIKDGDFIGYIGTTRNISEKKQCEYQMNQYIEELKIANAKLEQMAITDILTGVYNRRKFDNDLNVLIEYPGTVFSLLFFDIDHFKTVNDQFGHKTGDLVLQHISKLVPENLRKTDRFYRWGGEEFIVILLDSDLEFARNSAEKIRQVIAEEDFGIKRAITVSMGVSEHRTSEDADQIINRIDKILYEAKIQGGNRIFA